MGAWSKLFALNTLVDVIRVPKGITSGEWLPIDITFMSIYMRIVEESRIN